MEQIILHRGGELVTKEQLDLIRMPEATESYVPVSHYHLADKLESLSCDILKDYILVGQSYALARQGNQMFALLKFQKDEGEMALSIAFRNSYDRSMSLGVAVGASVFVCDNLALNGDIVIMRKHTKNVWTELEDLAIATLYKAGKKYEQIQADAQLLKRQKVQDDEAFMFMGMLYGFGIISPRQLTVIKDEWLKPSHEEFKEKTMWSLLNGTTEALKTCPPISIMEKHAQAYKFLGKGIVPQLTP